MNIRQNDGDGWARKGQTRITMSFSIVETNTAKIIWEATADGIYTTGSAADEAPPIKDTIDLAMQKIKENIPLL